jgi:hypothetical protein
MSSSVEWLSNQTYELFEQYSEGNFDRITLNRLVLEATEKAKEMGKEQMRLDIEKKWEQYRIITNNEDAWSFKEWLIKQTYGDKRQTSSIAE